MMSVTNRDLIKAARERDCEMLSSCTEHGADQEYFEDADANTALHIVLKEVWNYNEYLAEAERLGLTVNLEMRVRCDMTSRLNPGNRAARKKLKGDIKDWNEQHKLDMEMVEVLVHQGFADPRNQNAAGHNALDIARDADPDLKMILEDRVQFLEQEQEAESQTGNFTCTKGHSLVRERSERNWCDRCSGTCTSFRCSAGCDYDICQGCWDKELSLGKFGLRLRDHDCVAAVCVAAVCVAAAHDH